MGLIIGSARIDENGHVSGGKAGDQKQKSKINDTIGEVSMQEFYIHNKGWLVMRPKSVVHANVIAEKTINACNNENIGYDQKNRLGIIVYGTESKIKTECDCSSLVRQIIREATEKDPGNFTTYDEVNKLKATGLFEEPITFKNLSATPVYNGDILVTKSKGHTAVVVGGNQRSTDAGYYPKYTGKTNSIVTALIAVGEKDTSKVHRAKIAIANGIENYAFTAEQNLKMVKLLKEGFLKKA